MPTATPASPAAPTPRAQKATASSGHRHTPSTGQVRSGNGGTPKQLANGVRTSKVRGSAEAGEDRGRAERADLASRGKMPSKDGTAQRNAKEVEGLKDYQLGDCVGRGAFGSVYRALNWSTGETVAIKQVRLADLPRSELNVIMQEIDLLKNLNHPNIVKYHGFVKSYESLYIILEYCENGSLHSICKNFGKFPENLVSLYTAQVLQGLLFLHEQGVIHRDIKGANILTTKEGLVKLADFGVATKAQGLAEGSVVGTPYWMAPEVIELSGATTASDVWSLGCTVIELLDGKPPYHKLAPMPALFRIVNDDHPPIPEGVSPLVRDFLMQCFQKDPNLRVTAKKLLKHPWIVSGKKTDVKKPTEYDEAVKSVQEWNEALKSSPPNGNAGSRRGSARAVSRSPIPPVRHEAPSKKQYETPAVCKKPLQIGQRKPEPTALYQSPEDEEKKDNWDDDFESSIPPSALQLPHLRPQDNFAGLFSAEKLKQYASMDPLQEEGNKVEDWDGEFEGDLTVRSPMRLAKGDAVETVRPFYPPRTSSSEIKHNPPPKPSHGQAQKSSSKHHHERKISRDSQPKTQILRPAAKPPVPIQSKPVPAAKKLPPPKQSHVEDEDDDFSDLVPVDEAAFLKRLASFSPKPTDIQNLQPRVGGSVKRVPSQNVHDAAAMRRTRSSLEIQKYAEVDEDEDFTDLCFKDEDETPVSLNAGKPDSEPSGSERGTLKLMNSKLSNGSWLGDEEDEDDPFAQLEEELDEVDLESNVARDKHARLCTLVEGLVTDLKLTQPDDILSDIVEQLLQILFESPDVKNVIVSSHGMLPILEILDTCTRPYTILHLLKILNIIISNNVEVQENLCFVGGIPIISKFAHKKYSSDIRLEAASFVRMMYQTSTLTLQMFVSCGGLNVLVEFLEEDYDSEAGRELVLVGVNGVWSVFELQGPTPKNDFCRIFSRSSVLYPLSLVLNRVLDEEGELAELVEGRIVNIFLLFSQAENHVKETVADRMVLKRVLKDLRRMSPVHQITMLKFIKNLSMLATTLDALQNSNAIEVLTDLLGASMSAKMGKHWREISNQVLNTMYNLCRLSKARQEDAALSGVIPLLQRIVKTERPLKEFALPILCDMAHSGKVGRKILWQNKGLAFYVSLLADQYWQVTALDAIFIWLQEETAKVEEQLLFSDAFRSAIVACFNESKADAFENLLEPLQKLLRLSPPIAASLAHSDLFTRTAAKLLTKKPLVRLNLLRVIRSICDASDEQGALIRSYNLLDSVTDLALHDPAILVRELANELVKSCEYTSVARRSALDARPIRRSSSSTMTPPPIHTSNLPSSSAPCTADRAVGGRGYFDLTGGLEMTRSRPSGASAAPSSPLYRPVSRDGSGSSSTSHSGLHGAHTPTSSAGGLTPMSATPGAGSTAWNANVSAAAKSRLPRTSHAHQAPASSSRAGSRLSLLPTSRPLSRQNSSRVSDVGVGGRVGDGRISDVGGREGKGENVTPTHAHSNSSNHGGAGAGAGSRAAAVANARRRRQTSGGEGVRG